MTDRAAVYTAARRRLTDLARTLSAEDLERPVPACPGWRVRDVYAHLAGLAHDVDDGSARGGDDWTAGHVEARRGTPIEDVLAEWERHASAPEKVLASGIAPQIALDVVTHEQDVLGALGRRDHRDGDHIAMLLDSGLRSLGRRIGEAGLAPLEARAGDRVEVLGEGEPVATVSAAPFELARALAGRRSAAQIAAFEWSGDSAPYVPLFAFLPMAAVDVVE